MRFLELNCFDSCCCCFLCGYVGTTARAVVTETRQLYEHEHTRFDYTHVKCQKAGKIFVKEFTEDFHEMSQVVSGNESVEH